MIDCFHAYHVNDECDRCVYGLAVTAEDFNAFHICFAIHDKSGEQICSHFAPPEERTLEHD